MKFLIKTKQIVLNQTWLVNEVLVWFVWRAEEVGQSLLSGCWLWYSPVGSFSFSQHMHNRFWTIFVLIWGIKGISVRLSTLSFIICLHLFSSVFLYGRMCCIGNPQCALSLGSPAPISSFKILSRTSGKTDHSLKSSKTSLFFSPMPLSFKDAAASRLACVCICP